MTLAEIERLIESKKRVIKESAQERATYDYIHADLVGRSIARLYSSSNSLPEIAEVYPTLFNTKEVEERKAAKKAQLSALRFKQFANSYNNKFKSKEVQQEVERTT